MNFHIHVDREDPTKVVVLVADEDGEVIDGAEFPVDERVNFKALAWTMGVLLRRVQPNERRSTRQ